MINLSITLLFWCNIFSCAFSYCHITILCKDLVYITSHGREYVTCVPGLNGSYKMQRHYVFHVNSAFSYRSLFDWRYKGFLSGICSSVIHPFLISLRGETGGLLTLSPTWLHIDLLHVITQGLIPTLWINMQGWDQTDEEHKETAKEGVNKGEKRMGWRCSVDGGCRISNPAFPFSCSSCSYGYLKGGLVLVPGGLWGGETRADCIFTTNFEKHKLMHPFIANHWNWNNL